MDINRKVKVIPEGTTYRVMLLRIFFRPLFHKIAEGLYVYTDFKAHVPSDISWSGMAKKKKSVAATKNRRYCAVTRLCK